MDPVNTVFMILVLQYIAVPLLKRCNIELPPLRKLWLACVWGALSMVAAIVLEKFRLAAPILRDANNKEVMNSSGVPISDINLWWIEIQYLLEAGGEACAWVAGIEFFYAEMPDSLKATGQGINQFANAFSALLMMAVTGIVSPLGWLPTNLNDGNLIGFYLIAMGLCAVGTLWGLFCEYLYAKGGGAFQKMQIAMAIAEEANEDHFIGAD